LLDERHASKLGETQSVGGDPKIPWSPGHYIQTSLLVQFACKGKIPRLLASHNAWYDSQHADHAGFRLSIIYLTYEDI